MVSKFLLPKICVVSQGKFLVKADLLISKQMWSVFSFSPTKINGGVAFKTIVFFWIIM